MINRWAFNPLASKLSQPKHLNIPSAFLVRTYLLFYRL